MSELIQLENLPVETLAEMANEAAAACEASGRKTVEHAATCGRALLAIRPQIPHGEWLGWLAENFSQSQSRASQYMSIANYYARNSLEAAETIQGALRMIAESPEKQAKKAEREAKKLETPPKSLAPATPAPPVSSGVIRNEDPPTPQVQPQKPAWLADPDELDRPAEDDLPPLPKTNTHHTSANRRTPDARETDRAGIVCPDDPRGLQDGGWYVWSEERNRLLPLTDEDVLRRFDQIRRERAPKAGKVMLVPASPPITTPVVEHATESVSSKPGKVPTLSQLRAAVDAKTEWGDALRESAKDWAVYKMTLAGKDKIRSMESWQKALTRMGNVAKDRDVATVCEAIEKAIANGWTGWEHLETGNDRKLRGAVGGRVYQQLQKAEVKYDPLPE